MKEDIKYLKASNKELIKNIKHIEEEFTDELDEDSDSIAGSEIPTCNKSMLQEEVKKNNADHKKQVMTENKCGKHDFVGKTELQLKKHFNPNHPNKCVETADEKKSGVNNTKCTLDTINDMFQIEIVECEQVYACKICDEGFDTDDEVRNLT